MVRSPEINHGLKKGPWTPEEDHKLRDYIKKHGHGSWQSLPERAGLNRCGKSCRLRWTNYLRPDIKRGHFSPEEEQTIIDLHSTLGNKWAMIAAHLPGRTDNEIKNYWNTHLRKKLLRAGIDPKTHQLVTDLSLLSSFNNFPMSLVDVRLLENILRLLNSNPLPSFLVNPLYPNMENGGLSGDYSQVANAFRPEEMDVINTEFCLPGLIPATAGDKNVESRSVHDYSPSPSPVVENYEGWGAAANDEAGGSFWKDIYYESFPSSSL